MFDLNKFKAKYEGDIFFKIMSINVKNVKTRNTNDSVSAIDLTVDTADLEGNNRKLLTTRIFVDYEEGSEFHLFAHAVNAVLPYSDNLNDLIGFEGKAYLTYYNDYARIKNWSFVMGTVKSEMAQAPKPYIKGQEPSQNDDNNFSEGD